MLATNHAHAVPIWTGELTEAGIHSFAERLEVET